MANEIAVKQDPMLQVIANAAADKSVDVNKMQALLQMRAELQAHEAARAFYSAFARMQGELPSISKDGKIKDKIGRVQSTFAYWEDINKAITPILKAHGFVLMFQTKESDGTVFIRGTLAHESGHKETSEIRLPADEGGAKNAVQALGSSVSYGKRYMACALLNINTHGEDDDGNGGHQEESAKLKELLAALNEAAKGGMKALTERWQAMTQAERQEVGTRFGEIKKIAEAAK